MGGKNSCTVQMLCVLKNLLQTNATTIESIKTTIDILKQIKDLSLQNKTGKHIAEELGSLFVLLNTSV